GGDHLQKSGSPEKIRHGEWQDSTPPRHRHARAPASQDHTRDQAEPISAHDEIRRGFRRPPVVASLWDAPLRTANGPTLRVAERSGYSYARRAFSPCSISFQNSRVSPSWASSDTGSLLRKRKSRNVFLCKTRWTLMPSSVFAK